MCARLCGLGRRSLASTLEDLASAELDAGNLTKARRAAARALARRRFRSGGERPDQCEAMECLARYYIGVGQFARARTLYERVLAISEQTYGADHISCAADMANMSRTMKLMGDRGHAGRGASLAHLC